MRIMGDARDHGYCRFPAAATSLHGKSDLNSLDTTDLQKAYLPPHPPLCVPDASFPFAEIGTPVQCSRLGWALC